MQIEDKELWERIKNQVIYALRRLEDGSEYVNVDQLVKTFEGLYFTIEGLKGEVERYRQYVNKTNYDSEQIAINSTYQDIEIESLRSEVERYRTALEWYADKSLYGTWLVHAPVTRLEEDGGERARKALGNSL